MALGPIILSNMPDNLEKLHRRSIRYDGYDYTQPAAYFVTVVTHGHKCIFGKIINQEILLNNLGTIVEDCWRHLPAHFQNIEDEPFIIMPNHLHGIITIFDDDRRSRGTIYRAPTEEKFGKPVCGSLATIIRTYKAAVSRVAKRELGMVNLWQRNYYEHIIRNEHELANISNYILTNPLNWSADPEFIP